MRRYFTYICVCILTMLAVSCQQDAPLGADADEMVMTYSVKMPTMDASRVTMDGAKVNTLTVEAFEQDGEVWRSAYRKTGIMKNADGKFIIDVPMMKGRSYKVVFWAQNSEVTAYNTEDLSHIQVDYDNYRSGFESVENLDAFYYVDKVDDLKSESNGMVELKRPFVFLNIDNQSEYTPVSTTLTVKQAYTSFYPLKGEMGNPLQNQEFVFSGAKDDGTIAACLVFVPLKSSLGFKLEISNGTSITTKDVTIETVQANYRYNVKGELVGAPITHWKEKVESPSYDETTNRYVIQNEAQLAWWMDPVAEELKGGAKEIFIEKDLNMQDISMDALRIPGGITLNGNGKTIERLCLSGGLLGNAKNLTVHSLTISKAKVEATSGHVGVLVNTLTGSSTFTGVTVTNSSATTTNGAAGGMVGYITNEDDEKLEVTFSQCTATNNEVNGSLTSGVYVGRFRGYDNRETLTFSSDCNDSSATGVASYYITDNVATWLASNDYSKYSGWLGDEAYYRGIVNYGNNRFVVKWDGETAVEPIYEDSNKKIAQIWSPFDLAYLSGKSLTTLRFKIDVDMAGVCNDCKDGNGNSTIANDYLSTCTKCKAFSPIIQLNNLHGENHTLYNLFVQGEHEADGDYNDGMGFIRHTNAGTFENFTFDGVIIKCIDDKDYRNDDQKGGNGYAGTLTSRAAAKMTINNVHAKNGHVIGISKFGGLIGYVPGGINATGCTVDNYVIENHKINVVNSYSVSIEKEALGMKLKAECAEDFCTEGEAGGFIGFISSNATITDCRTSNITMKCYGIEDRDTKIKTYKWTQDEKWVQTGKWSWEGEMRPDGDPYWKSTGINLDYTIAGRHVNTFIGDIRTPSSNTVVINGCTTSGNCANGYDYNITKAGKGELVGCCYFVGKNIEVLGVSMHAGDYKGTVTIDGEEMPFVGG